MKLLYALLVFLFLPFQDGEKPPAPNVVLHIEGLRNSDGQIAIGIFKNDYNFQNELPDQGFLFDKSEGKDGNLTVELYLPPNETYGIAYLDDENDDRVMNYNFIGLPKEGFGMGGYYPGGLFKPSFDDFKFFLPEEEVLKMNSEVRYIL